ncbi:hypothetical protein PVAP13_1NG418138 [Panicum virgatum]|uniref:Uncharacterized protein n=1 Tax=Panicum virgatum TaxID=38727 RepID=A0A8T0WWK2_PANVG|nr:hypothetical protein PVAP13_1NG418138 [Panicum virgatum]
MVAMASGPATLHHNPPATFSLSGVRPALPSFEFTLPAASSGSPSAPLPRACTSRRSSRGSADGGACWRPAVHGAYISPRQSPCVDMAAGQRASVCSRRPDWRLACGRCGANGDCMSGAWQRGEAEIPCHGADISGCREGGGGCWPKGRRRGRQGSAVGMGAWRRRRRARV